MSKEKERFMFPFTMDKAVVKGKNGAVSSNSYYATEAGLEMLRNGGNAIDAAAATSLALSVVEPHHSGIGGGCFSVIYLAELDKTVTIDARGIAPIDATEDMFLEDGEVNDDWINFTARSSAVPSLYKALDNMLKEYGTMTLKEVSQPAIKLASEGFATSYALEYILESELVQKKIENTEEFRNLYTKDGELYKFGEIMVNKELANTMEDVANNGVEYFYNSIISEQIVKDINANNGVFTQDDLKEYDVHYGEPVRGKYRDYEIVAIDPPSSGGAHIIQMLNILENVELSELGHNTGESIHLIAEAMKIAFADRSIAMGDPRFVDIKLKDIISKEYGKEKFKEIDMNRALEYSPNQELEAKEYPGHTSHFSVMDKDGNVVSQTQTIRDWFGCGIVPKGTGFVMNNTMADFSAKAGVKTSQGLAYGSANAIRPKKTPLSSMSPMMLFKDNKPILSIGAAGGPRIITSTLQGILNIVDFGMRPDEAIRSPFIVAMTKHQGLELEPGISKDTVQILKDKGHDVKQGEFGEVITFMLNSVMEIDGYYYPSTTMRVDGCGGALTETGKMIMDGIVFD